MKLPRPKLTYANVVSTLCLVLVVGGSSAYAASEMLPENSVGPDQIRAGAVTQAKLAGAVENRLGTDVTVYVDRERVQPGVFGSVLAKCEGGEVAVGGSAGVGYGTSIGQLEFFTAGGSPWPKNDSENPPTPLGWQAQARNTSRENTGVIEVYAICARR